MMAKPSQLHHAMGHDLDSDLSFWARFLSRGLPTINIGQNGTPDLLLDGAFLTVELAEQAAPT
jgi:hypothetical protein